MLNRPTFILLALVLGTSCGAAEPEMATTTDTPGLEDPPKSYPQMAHIEPMPPIPEGIRGCWRSEESEDGGPAEIMEVSATQLKIDGRIARPEFVESVSPQAIYGRFSIAEGDNLATVATSLRLDADGIRPGRLVRQEGDAGSYVYSRC